MNEGRLPVDRNRHAKSPLRAGDPDHGTPDGIATQRSFKNKPMPKKTSELPLRMSFTNDEFAQIRRGFVPKSMDDRWFVFFDPITHQLSIHRSWTGFCIYIVQLEPVGNEWRIKSARVNRNPKQYKQTDINEDVAVVSWVIDDLLLGKDRELPTQLGRRP